MLKWQFHLHGGGAGAVYKPVFTVPFVVSVIGSVVAKTPAKTFAQQDQKKHDDKNYEYENVRMTCNPFSHVVRHFKTKLDKKRN